MKASLRPGVARTKRIAIDRDRTISFMGEEARVYATPRLVSDVEYTCRDFLLAHLDAGEDSVGTQVHWHHVGPALLGAEVAIEVKLVNVDGRRVTFEAQVSDGADAVAHGTHERFVVDVQRVRERLLKKARSSASRP